MSIASLDSRHSSYDSNRKISDLTRYPSSSSLTRKTHFTIFGGPVPDSLQGESPIDLTKDKVVSEYPTTALEWKNWTVKPLYLKLSNYRKTVILSGLWPESHLPKITGGPVSSPYCFAQLHYHWGEDDSHGGEHTVEGEHLPFELHVVLYKEEYKNIELAKQQDDGVVILSYLYFVGDPEKRIDYVIENLPTIQNPLIQAQVPLETLSLISFVKPFSSDYIAYVGRMSRRSRDVMWIISREEMFISSDQIKAFRQVMDESGKPITENSRSVKTVSDQKVYMVGGKVGSIIIHRATEKDSTRSSTRLKSVPKQKKSKK